MFCTEPTRAAKAEQKSLVPARQGQQTNQQGPLSFVLFKSPFTSVSTVGRGHPSLVSLDKTATSSFYIFPLSSWEIRWMVGVGGGGYFFFQHHPVYSRILFNYLKTTSPFTFLGYFLRLGKLCNFYICFKTCVRSHFYCKFFVIHCREKCI
jgi:hypothetical protein